MGLWASNLSDKLGDLLDIDQGKFAIVYASTECEIKKRQRFVYAPIPKPLERLSYLIFLTQTVQASCNNINSDCTSVLQPIYTVRRMYNSSGMV